MDIEQSTLIWIVRVIFFAVAVVISFLVWRLMRRERTVVVQGLAPYVPPEHINLPEKIIALTVMAKPGRIFDTPHLFKVMHELGFKYNDNQVFDYYVPNSDYIAFSVINQRRPYRFSYNPQEMASTNGLMAVMQLPIADGDQQVDYFHLLLSVLDELRNNLDAELCNANRRPLQNNQLYALQKDIETFEQNYAAAIQNAYKH